MLCPDYREDRFVDRLIDIFKRPEIVFDTTGIPAERRLRDIIRRVFRR
jgi:hypothetical protein